MAGYYDLEAILRDEERVPVVFNTDAAGMGHLDPANESDDLGEGTRLELPLWLARSLGQRNFVSVELPRVFSGKTEQALIADARAVKLRDKGPYYYELGMELSKVLVPPQPELSKSMRSTLARRYPQLLDLSTSSLGEDRTQYTDQLTDLERKLWQTGYWNASTFYDWKRRRSQKLTRSSLMKAHKRRRRPRS